MGRSGSGPVRGKDISSSSLDPASRERAQTHLDPPRHSVSSHTFSVQVSLSILMIALTLERPTVQMHTHISVTHLLTHSDTHAHTHPHIRALYFVVKLVAKKTKFFFFFLISHTLFVITCREDALLFLPYTEQGRCTSSGGDVGLQWLLAGIELSLERLGFGVVLDLGV